MTIISEIKNLYSKQTRANIIEFLDTDVYQTPVNTGDDGCRRHAWSDLPFFEKEHRRLTNLASKVFEEEVVPTYTCLSSYFTDVGTLGVHLDNERCRYTISYMIRCDGIPSWPMYVGKNEFSENERPTTQAERFPQGTKAIQKIMDSMEWAKIDHSPNSAAFFSGTHRWHYRDQIPAGAADTIMFHYVPLHPEMPRPETEKPPLV
jgi:hypothetical protein